MLSQRVYGLALGYEDLDDHEQLRADPLFGLLSSRRAEPCQKPAPSAAAHWLAAAHGSHDLRHAENRAQATNNTH